MLKKFWWVLPALLVLAAAGFVIWGASAAAPMPEAEAAMRSNADVAVEAARWLVFSPVKTKPQAGFIFYPGGRVDPRAYAPYAQAIASQGFLVVIPPMPLNLAVFAPNTAGEVMAAYPEIKTWAVGGHSLGGAMACAFVYSHPDAAKGLILWASYPAGSNSLADRSLAVVSIHGSLDGLATPAKIEASRPLLPASTRFVTIEGGDHAQFGWYGPQSGDQPASISRQAQQDQVVAASLALLAQIAPGAAAAAPASPTAAVPAAPTAPAPTATPVELPKIGAFHLDRAELPRFETLEISVTLEAKYANPFDARQVRLDGAFTGPDGKSMQTPGFWDAESAWRVRFTPDQVGEWNFSLQVTDGRGASQPASGKFTVTASDLHGWLQVGKEVNPAYSSHYLVYRDGAPFYGVGHADAANILADGFDINRGVHLFDNMQAAGENYVVWWPMYNYSPLINSYDDYFVNNLKLIDLIVNDARKKGIYLIFTVWDHPELRAAGHPWGNGRWAANGFSKLSSIEAFFTDPEPWAWQENFYRYLIARYSSSPAIAMWLTVSEINGTNAYDQTDAWHAKVNDYFVKNDPYRHPTTASMSGDTDWPAGFRAMDVAQVHVYNLQDMPLKSADVMAHWTQVMWSYDRPNWVGEYGVIARDQYPELLHNANWGALSAGAALNPAEWNDRNQWGEMTSDLYGDNGRLALFVAGLPLAKWNPSPLKIQAVDGGAGSPAVRGWGVGGKDGGLAWVQDFSLEGQPIDQLRLNQQVVRGLQIEITNLPGGTYTVTPFNTWQGTWLEPIELTCQDRSACRLALPDFKADLALKFERK